jgi:hypothetical protein
MFDTTKIVASAYSHRLAETAKTTAKQTATFTSDHKSELKTAGATAVIVGLTARVFGFKAGYAFAKNGTPNS